MNSPTENMRILKRGGSRTSSSLANFKGLTEKEATARRLRGVANEV